jgi:hypothetical protein
MVLAQPHHCCLLLPLLPLLPLLLLLLRLAALLLVWVLPVGCS